MVCGLSSDAYALNSTTGQGLCSWPQTSDFCLWSPDHVRTQADGLACGRPWDSTHPVGGEPCAVAFSSEALAHDLLRDAQALCGELSTPTKSTGRREKAHFVQVQCAVKGVLVALASTLAHAPLQSITLARASGFGERFWGLLATTPTDIHALRERWDGSVRCMLKLPSCATLLLSGLTRACAVGGEEACRALALSDKVLEHVAGRQDSVRCGHRPEFKVEKRRDAPSSFSKMAWMLLLLSSSSCLHSPAVMRNAPFSMPTCI